VHRRVLREDRDALLALEVTGVHRPLGDVLVRAEGPGLPEHGVDQGGLPVVDVGDDRDVAQVGAQGHAISFLLGCSASLPAASFRRRGGSA